MTYNFSCRRIPFRFQLIVDSQLSIMNFQYDVHHWLREYLLDKHWTFIHLLYDSILCTNLIKFVSSFIPDHVLYEPFSACCKFSLAVWRFFIAIKLFEHNGHRTLDPCQLSADTSARFTFSTSSSLWRNTAFVILHTDWRLCTCCTMFQIILELTSVFSSEHSNMATWRFTSFWLKSCMILSKSSRVSTLCTKSFDNDRPTFTLHPKRTS